jgi:hypothetical protein
MRCSTCGSDNGLCLLQTSIPQSSYETFYAIVGSGHFMELSISTTNHNAS